MSSPSLPPPAPFCKPEFGPPPFFFPRPNQTGTNVPLSAPIPSSRPFLLSRLSRLLRFFPGPARRIGPSNAEKAAFAAFSSPLPGLCRFDQSRATALSKMAWTSTPGFAVASVATTANTSPAAKPGTIS